jgi:hypothetical protein
MVLEYLGLTIDDTRLAKLLRAGADFTPFGHLRFLAQLGLSVIWGMQSEVSLFETYIELGLPVIVGVKTLNWPHWEGVITEHAVLVVGIDQAQDRIYLHDPFFAQAPIEMSLIEFEVGWIEQEGYYAVVGLAPPDEQS